LLPLSNHPQLHRLPLRQGPSYPAYHR
jgi:hypothetical protein